MIRGEPETDDRGSQNVPSTPVAEGVRLAATRQRVGRSGLGRPIEAFILGPRQGALRLLVIAGQHGDEPGGRAAARQWIGEAAARGCVGLVGHATIPDANPDGALAGTRRNARGIDLNRDHLALTAPETRAIHAFVRRYRPHLIVDVHNYPARRSHLLARGWTIDAEVQLAVPTNPAIRTSLDETDLEDLTRRMQSDLSAGGYFATPYTLFRRSGKARPSTLTTVDARNTISLRYGIPTLLLEGRDAGRDGTQEEADRIVAALREALRSIEAWACEHRQNLLRGPPSSHAGDIVPVDAYWAPSLRPQPVVFRDATSGRREVVPWTSFAGTVRVRRVVRLPHAYAVRMDARGAREVLERHGFQAVAAAWLSSDRSGPTEDGQASPRRKALNPHHTESACLLNPGDYLIFDAGEGGGRALALWLETRSRFGLVRWGILPEPSSSDSALTVLRVRADVGPRPRQARPKAQRLHEPFPAAGERRPATSGRSMPDDQPSHSRGSRADAFQEREG